MLVFWTALIPGAFILSWTLTGAFRRCALHRHIFDIPNARSSHVQPTPRGGGVGFVVVFLTVLLVLAGAEIVTLSTAMAFGVAGLLVAIIGFCDDLKGVPWKARLSVQLLSALWGVFWLGGMPNVQLGPLVLDVQAINNAIAVFGVVWVLNLYNFMDGIDGIAGGEAVFVATAYAFFAASNEGWELAAMSSVLAAAAVGFLLWNWAPAKIFMGDIGSGFLGLIFGLLAVAGQNAGVVSIWTSLILLGVFIADATTTLVRRMARGERWHEAHRTHAYQYLSRRWGHARTTGGVLVINIFWLLPLAFVAEQFVMWAPIVTAIALLPLVGLALACSAGRAEGVVQSANVS